MRNLSLTVVAAAALVTPCVAQFTLVAPPICATAEGSVNNVFPWGRTLPQRYQQIYDSTTFTSQNVSSPILINNLRFRANGTTASWPGGTWPGPINVKLSTSPVDYLAFSTTFANNQGPNLTTVHSGPVIKLPGTGLGTTTPGPWFIDITLSTPFLYDPASGDLTMDVEMDPTGFTGTVTTPADAENSPNALCSRLWESTSATATTALASAANYGVVTEFGYVPAAGYAYAANYGTGCTNQAKESFYQTGPFDLSNTSLMFTLAGSGYVVLPGSSIWHTPTTAPVPMLDDQVLTFALGFQLPFPGGTTSSLYISSNGFIGASPTLAHGCCVGNVGALLTGGARWAALWHDLNPAAGGSVYFETDSVGTAYITFSQVFQDSTTIPNTFQYAFNSAGGVVLRYQACGVSAALVGWSPGTNSLDPGAIDISMQPVILTMPDIRAITHSAGARPVIGTNILMNTNNVPAAAILGANILGLADYTGGISLSAIGMPGCFQYTSADATLVFLPAGSVGSTPFNIPNTPAVLAGVQIKSQGACLVPGINQIGAVSSNGVRLVLDIN